MADKCPPCKKGAPEWMATFSDMCQLLLTFFILLLSFAKTETAKYEAAMGSIRNAFGGNVMKAGETAMMGKSPSDALTMIDTDQPPRPFPIEFLSSEGLLDKQEINRESDAQLSEMKKMLQEYDLAEDANVYEMPESISVRMKDKFLFALNSMSVEQADAQIFDRILTMLKDHNWVIIIEGHAAKNETDPWVLSAKRAGAIAQLIMSRGIAPERVSVVSYGDSRPQSASTDNAEINDRRVEFMIRKSDLRKEGKKVRAD
jgi:chemotaxis protein MotB